MTEKPVIFCALVNELMAAHETGNGIKLQQLEGMIINHYKKGRLDYYRYTTLMRLHYILMDEWRKKTHGKA